MAADPQRISGRGLNRATLARQFLLERARRPAFAAIEQLAGLQAQAPLAPYVGLWTRLVDFHPDELSALTRDRRVVRIHLMRNTVHLVTADDALGWQPRFAPLHAAQFATQFGRALAGVDQDALARHARRLFDQGPQTRADLRAALHRRWPDADPDALVHAVRHRLALCQLPPRGIWGRGGPVVLAPLRTYVGQRSRAAPITHLIMRYLAAFGPASVADIQRWSGLTRLRAVVETMPLVPLLGPDGQRLFDLPDAPRPDEDLPAPPRLLPAYDNLLLSYADRGRVNPDNRPVPLPPGNGTTTGTFLIDGTWAGTWRIEERALRLRPFTWLRPADRDALITEAAGLAALVAPATDVELTTHH